MKKRILIISTVAAILLLLSGLAAAVLFEPESAGAEPTTRPTAVSVAQPTIQAVYEKISYLGTVEGAADVEVSFRIGGTISAVHVREGDVVRRGDALAALDHTEMKARLDRVRAEMEKAEADLSHWRAELAIDERLLAKGALSRSRRNQTKLAYENAERARTAAAASVEESAGAAAAAIVRAPETGVVGRVDRKAGETVMPGQPVVSINAGERRLRIDVLETDISKGISLGTRADVASTSCGEAAGEVVQVDGAVRGPYRSVRVYVALPPPCLRGRPAGATVPVTFRIRHEADATMLPASAVDFRAGSPRVFRVSNDGRAEPVSIELGLQDGATQQVRGDLGPDDLVVVSGATNIEVGDRVRFTNDSARAEGALR